MKKISVVEQKVIIFSDPITLYKECEMHDVIYKQIDVE